MTTPQQDATYISIFPAPEKLRQMTPEELRAATPGEVFAHYHTQLPWLRPMWDKDKLPQHNSERSAWIGASHCEGGWTPIAQGWEPADSCRLWLALERLLPLCLDPTVEEVWIQKLLNPPIGYTSSPGYLDILSDGLLGVRVHPELRLPERSLMDAFTTILSKGGKKLYGLRTPEGTPIVESPLESPGVRLAGGVPPLSIAPFAAIRIPARVKPVIDHLSGAEAFPPAYDTSLVAPGTPLRPPAHDPIAEAKKKIDTHGAKGRVMFPVEALEYLRCLFAVGWNPVFAGATSSAKTTALNASLNLMPPQWRIVTMEHNVFELKLPHVNWLPLLSSDNLLDPEGKPVLTPERVLSLVLRLSPKPIPVGEIRAKEGSGWVKATTTGHEASPTTLHAGSPAETIQRLATDMIMPANPGMSLEVARMLACKAANVVVQLARQEVLENGRVVSRRRCVSIHEVHLKGNFVEGREEAELVPIFSTIVTDGEPELRYVGGDKSNLWPLMRARYMDENIPMWAR